ncbi:hypothetical protein Ddye_010422 [Dipteronia dyeriana]|uniref:Uncharacterized protein n=1 Tax=Dipteronia dyeriana TaxID=168575 RepID=A0AAE0CN52_9ROSI|nr:hypothetical protein Ddye_010422 [Dipteronia dyeriana]
MAYILMVCQFFGKDDQMSAIPGWLIFLTDNEQAFTNFPWGTYIFSMTLFSLHSSTEKRLQRLRGKKPYTYNIHGFALAFQVWAIETIPRLTNVVGTRIGSGFPRINNWNFNKKTVKIENKFTSGGISLVNGELDPKELETDYYKSLDPDYVCGKLLHKGKVVEVEDVINDEEDVGSDEDRDKKLEDPVNNNDEDAAFSNHQRTTLVIRSSNSISEPPAK